MLPVEYRLRKGSIYTRNYLHVQSVRSFLYRLGMVIQSYQVHIAVHTLLGCTSVCRSQVNARFGLLDVAVSRSLRWLGCRYPWAPSIMSTIYLLCLRWAPPTELPTMSAFRCFLILIAYVWLPWQHCIRCYFDNHYLLYLVHLSPFNESIMFTYLTEWACPSQHLNTWLFSEVIPYYHYVPTILGSTLNFLHILMQPRCYMNFFK